MFERALRVCKLIKHFYGWTWNKRVRDTKALCVTWERDIKEYWAAKDKPVHVSVSQLFHTAHYLKKKKSKGDS